MNLTKQTYFGIAGGMLFLFLLTSIAFIILGINKEEPLFDNVAITIGLASSLFILLFGSVISLFLASKKSQTTNK
ncbi:hypothetical protein ABWH96_14290 [Marivirga tractuosa]|uniref:hypothetical protein n=1 Tax=Marivirga tractuosa TaxID=1006 RepID=UPI0035D0A24D